MATVAIVYHSGYGHTKALAESVRKGAASAGQAKLLSAEEFNPPNDNKEYGPEWDALNDADAIVFGCPTYMGSASAGMKKFFEASSGIWGKQKWKDKLAGGFTNSGSLDGDKRNTLVDLAAFAAQHGMIWVGLGMMPSGQGDDDTNRLGAYFGLEAQSDVNAGPGEAPPKGDHKTAEAFGKRIAELASKWAG